MKTLMAKCSASALMAVLLSIQIFHSCISTETVSASAATASTTHTSKLDLSYLHRTKARSLSVAIRQRLQQQAQDNGPIEIDLTASLIDKDVQEILSAFPGGSRDGNTNPAFVRLTTRRNQWTSKEVNTLLQTIFAKQKEGKEDATKDVEEKNGASNKDGSSQDAGNEDKESLKSADETKDASTPESSVSANEISEQQSSSPPPPPRKPAFVVQSLDLGWNNFGSSGNNNKSLKALHKAWQDLLATSNCPSTLCFDVCGLGPAACRAMAKGILARYTYKDRADEDDNDGTETTTQQNRTPPAPLSLHLACNEGIGDAGVAALAAAVRTVATQQSKRNDTSESHGEPNEEDFTVLETLDLSGCSITDVGAEALAIALERHPLCIKHLDLSNNQFTDEGAASLARALLVKTKNGQRCGKIETLDLSHNKDIGDRGAAELATAFQEGCIQNLILRSCQLHADGAASFGMALKALAIKHASEESDDIVPLKVEIDLSGNPLGILRKKPKSGNKYSASALKSKATETTAAYMGFLSKTVKKGLQDLGLAESADGFDTLESDDEEESRMGKNGEEDDESRNKCAAISLAEAFVDDDAEEHEEASTSDTTRDPRKLLNVKLGLRHCSFDTRAAEALAAVLQESRKKQLAMNLTLDMTMNYVLEDETIAALHGESGYEDQISDMADNYLEAVAVIKEAQERALEAARIARTRAREEAELEDAWGSPVGVSAGNYGWDDDGYDEAAWDSDADYDVPDENEW